MGEKVKAHGERSSNAEPSAVVLRWCGGRGKEGGHMEDSLLPPLATFDPLDNISFETNILKA